MNPWHFALHCSLHFTDPPWCYENFYTGNLKRFTLNYWELFLFDCGFMFMSPHSRFNAKSKVNSPPNKVQVARSFFISQTPMINLFGHKCMWKTQRWTSSFWLRLMNLLWISLRLGGSVEEALRLSPKVTWLTIQNYDHMNTHTFFS
jgi:hypothetical protein